MCQTIPNLSLPMPENLCLSLGLAAFGDCLCDPNPSTEADLEFLAIFRTFDLSTAKKEFCDLTE